VNCKNVYIKYLPNTYLILLLLFIIIFIIIIVIIFTFKFIPDIFHFNSMFVVQKTTTEIQNSTSKLSNNKRERPKQQPQ